MDPHVAESGPGLRSLCERGAEPNRQCSRTHTAADAAFPSGDDITDGTASESHQTWAPSVHVATDNLKEPVSAMIYLSWVKLYQPGRI